MATWTKMKFGTNPVTESPSGKNLKRLQASLSGAVVLALDVSGSMSGSRLTEAKEGCRRFIAEAIGDGYSVGLLLWHHGLAGCSPLERTPDSAYQLLADATTAGGNDVVPCLQEAHRMLMADLANDRVLAIFGDGDLGSVEHAKSGAAVLRADGIRILTCGLGMASAESLAVISDECDTAPRVADSGRIADAIVGMTAGLTSKGRK